MAISLSASTVPSLSTRASSLSAYCPKLSSLPPVRFPAKFRRIGTGDRRIASPSTPRYVPLAIKARKKTYNSIDDLLENFDKPVLVDFYATWCGPCQLMVDVLNEVSAIMKDKIQVVKIDTEKYPNLAGKYSVEALPTFILFKDGKPCDRFEGALPAKQLIERIENSLQVKQ